jgi:hypothetical protein
VMECNLTGERRGGPGRMSGAVSCCYKLWETMFVGLYLRETWGVCLGARLA